MMIRIALCCLFCLPATPLKAADPAGTVILQDDFDREEQDNSKEQVGNNWGTNSKSRAKGVKQVDLVDGAMHITRAEVADHGVSVTHEVEFKDAIIELRFKFGPKEDLGINIADMKEKSVHAGHICMARLKPWQVELVDLKTGVMDLPTRTRRLAKTDTDADKQRIKNCSNKIKHNIKTDKWHQLKMSIVGETMTLMIDGKEIGTFQSPGIGHPTKSRIRLAVNTEAWVDDVKITRLK